MTLKKGHNSTNGDNPDLKKDRCQLFFDEESFMKFQTCILINKFCNGRTNGHTDGQAKSNMPHQFFQSWGHKKCDISNNNSQF